MKQYFLLRRWMAFTFAICLCGAVFAQTHISDRAGLENIKNGLSGSYILDNDIDLSGSNWTPLSNFTGTLDGNGHVIFNLTIDNLDAAAFFNTISGNAIVKNLGFENALITDATHSRTAVLAAFMEGNAIIENCYIANSTISGRWCVGSFVGRARNATNAIIRNCYSSAYIYNPVTNLNAGQTGGIIGNIYNSNGDNNTPVTVENCYFSGFIQKGINTSETPAEGQICGIAGWIGDDDNPQTLTGYSIKNNVNLAPYLLSNNGKHRISSTRGDAAGNDPTPGPNYSISTTSLSGYNDWGNTAAIVTTGTETNKDGLNLPGGDSDAKSKAFYEGIGWDFTAGTGIWTIDEGASYPYFSWAKNNTAFVVAPVETIHLSESNPVDLSKYIFSGRGRPLSFTSNSAKVTISGNVATLVPPIPMTETVTVTVQEGNLTPTHTLNIALTPTASINADLSGITLSAGQLVPDFHPEVTQYAVSVPAGVNMITAAAIAADTGASVSGDGEADVTNTTVQTITVTAAAQNTKTYTIEYIRIGEDETDITALIVNNSFEYVRSGVTVSAIADAGSGDGWFSNAWRPKKSTEGEFYGWNVTDWNSFRTGENFSQGIQRTDITNVDGVWGVWIMGDLTFPSLWELYQTIPASSLPAGTYKVQCRLDHEGAKRTSQRLFANQNVQYHGTESQYPSNLTDGEINTFAGHAAEITKLKEMVVYTTIGDGDDLKFGIRTGGILPNGTPSANANPLNGGFKVDYFRVTKIADNEAGNADLSALTVSEGTLVPAFSAEQTTYDVVLPYGVTTVTPTATLSSELATITGADAVNVTEGAGTSTIVVTAVNGSQKTYTLNYVVASGSDATLADLTVSAGTLVPAFNAAVAEYTVIIPANVTSITPVATKNDAGATITGDDTVDVSDGSGTSAIVVTAVNGETTKTYTIVYSQAADLTALIVNNDFSYIAEGVSADDYFSTPTLQMQYPYFLSNAWRPVQANVTTLADHKEFYGWTMSDWEFLFKDENGNWINQDQTIPNQSIGLTNGITPGVHDNHCVWINGARACKVPEDFEFYQVIDKDKLEAGTYRVNAAVGIDDDGNKRTSQRLFANNNVQYVSSAGKYGLNVKQTENYTFGGYDTGLGADNLKELKVYVTIGDNDSLKIGIRTGNMQPDGTYTTDGSGNMIGWVKFDYFRLTKLEPSIASDATLASLSLSEGTLDFDPATTSYEVGLPSGTTSVTPTAVPAQTDAIVTGVETIDVSGGSGTSTLVVTALDGTTVVTYTVIYSVGVTALPSLPVQEDLVVSQQYYTLQGVALEKPEAVGIYILRQTTQSGRVIITKVLNSGSK